MLSAREITADEVAHFHEQGWAHLPNLVDRAQIERTYKSAESMLDKDASLNHGGAGQFFDAIPGGDSVERQDIFLSAPMGRGLQRLLGIPAIRLWGDAFILKKPEAGGHKGTLYHQDFPGLPIDRSNYLSIWIALHDMPAEAGTLRFYSGSHRLGILGWVFADGISLEQRCAQLRPENLSPLRAMKAGDATIHHSLTVHGAPANGTSRNRWARTAVFMDAEARQKNDVAGLPPGVPRNPAGLFDNPACPIVPSD